MTFLNLGTQRPNCIVLRFIILYRSRFHRSRSLPLFFIDDAVIKNLVCDIFKCTQRPYCKILGIVIVPPEDCPRVE